MGQAEIVDDKPAVGDGDIACKHFLRAVAQGFSRSNEVIDWHDTGGDFRGHARQISVARKNDVIGSDVAGLGLDHCWCAFAQPRYARSFVNGDACLKGSPGEPKRKSERVQMRATRGQRTAHVVWRRAQRKTLLLA